MKDYDYKKMLVESYEFSPYMAKERKENNDISNFYIKEAQESGINILEFGTATGLLTIPLAKAGFIIDTVDISYEMHKYVTKKINMEHDYIKNSINLINSDILDFTSDKKYDTIIMADNLFLAITDLEQQLNLLKKAHSLLADRGKLLMDIFTPDLNEIANGNSRNKEEFYIGKSKYVTERFVRVNPLNQLLHIKFIHTMPDNDIFVDKSSITFRYIYPDELKLLLRMANFSDFKIYDDFNWNIKRKYNSLQVVSAKKI